MKPLFIVLEPINHMFKVIEAASRRGCDVLVIHSLPLTPPAPYDEALSCVAATQWVHSWINIDVVLNTIDALVAKREVVGTYAGMEVTLQCDAHLRLKHGLPVNRIEVIELVQNKGRVRTMLRESKLSSLRQVDEATLRALKQWPFENKAAFFKPVNGAGSAHVSRCDSLDDVARCLREWDTGNAALPNYLTAYMKSGQGVYLEEGAAGELMSLEGYMCDGRYTPIGLTSRDVLARDVTIEMGATFPYITPRWKEIVTKVERMHFTLGISHGPTHTEIMVPRNGADIELVEMNIRFVGADVLILINEAFGVRFEETLVDLAMGKVPHFQRPNTVQAFSSVQYLLPPEGTDALHTIDLAAPEIVFSKLIKILGGSLDSCQFQTDQIAGFIVRAASYDEVTNVARRVRETIKVNGVALGRNPNNIIDRY